MKFANVSRPVVSPQDPKTPSKTPNGVREATARNLEARAKTPNGVREATNGVREAIARNPEARSDLNAERARISGRNDGQTVRVTAEKVR